MWCVDTAEVYAGVKINEIMTFSGKWMQLENSCLKHDESGLESYIVYVSSHVEPQFKFYMCVYVCIHIYVCL